MQVPQGATPTDREGERGDEARGGGGPRAGCRRSAREASTGATEGQQDEQGQGEGGGAHGHACTGHRAECSCFVRQGTQLVAIVWRRDDAVSGGVPGGATRSGSLVFSVEKWGTWLGFRRDRTTCSGQRGWLVASLPGSLLGVWRTRVG